MSGGGSNKPIVFVFNHTTGDAAGRKKNLSAINTQVAYRAHERRREKKNKQRAQAKDLDADKVDQPTSSVATKSAPPATATTQSRNDINFDFYHYQPARPDSYRVPVGPGDPSYHVAQPQFLPAEAIPHDNHRNSFGFRNPDGVRQDADLASEVSSDHDAIWSASPASNQYSSPSTDLSAYSPRTYAPINGYFDRALDPFFRLPSIASDREKWLVHFYFSEMGHLGFGTHQNSLFCPDRDWVSTYVSTKSSCFQWVLILAEEHLCRMGVPGDEAQTLARKAKAYSSLNSILNSNSVDRDEQVSSIMFAAIVDTSQSNMHLSALDRLIGKTGGFEAYMDGPLGVSRPEHIASAFAFGACPILNVETLNVVKSRFLDTLRVFYGEAQIEQEQMLRIRNRRPWDSLGRQNVDSNGSLVPSSYDEHLRYYIKARQDSLVGSDCLGRLLITSLDIQADYTSQARHIAALIQTLMIVHEFDGNYLARAMFLKRLQHVTDLSTARDLVTAQAYLSHAGLLLINAFVRQEVQTHFDRTKTLSKGIAISKVIVDTLKIVPLLSPPSRGLVVSWLRDWLCYSDRFEYADFGHLTEQDLTLISAEITNNWYKSNNGG